MAYGTWRSALRLAALAVLTGCSDECPGFEPQETPRPAVTRVLVAPNDVWVDATVATTFSLRALVELADGTLHEARPGEVTWSANAPPVQASATGTGPLGTVHVTPQVGDLFMVTAASTNGVSGSATVRRYPGSGGQLINRKSVQAPFKAGDLPTIAIASGSQAGNCVDQPVAFVKKGALPTVNMNALCRNDAAVLSPSDAFWHSEVQWTAGTQMIGPSVSTAPRTIQATLIIGVTDSYCPEPWPADCVHLSDAQKGAKDLMRESKDLANEIFAQAGTGLRVAFDIYDNVQQAELFGVTDCGSLPSAEDLKPRLDRVTIYVVDQLDAGDGPIAGLACRDGVDGAPGHYPVILIGYRYGQSWSTLAHEFTHLFGHRWPPHVDQGISGIDSYNLMTSESSVGVERFHLTVGQAYRMALDTRSWANRNPVSPDARQCTCANTDAAKPCPKLARDVKPMEGSVTVTGSACTP